MLQLADCRCQCNEGGFDKLLSNISIRGYLNSPGEYDLIVGAEMENENAVEFDN